jgi:endonuclease/exonuclease/phosphatase family metal-dependent hydrolase
VRIRVATANIGGGARREKADPCKYTMLGEILSGVDIIGLQEIVRVEDPIGKLIRDDIRELQSSGLSDYQHFFFPHLDSRPQSHPRKWEGSRSAFSSYYERGYHILQGSAILLRQQHCIYDFWRDRPGYAVGQIIPWYYERPTFYTGNRDTEPRSLLLARIRLRSEIVLFCCTQLTTLRGETRGSKSPPDKVTDEARKIRKKQIDWIVDYVKNYQDAHREEPIILVGDFNAELGEESLDGLHSLGLDFLGPLGDQKNAQGERIPTHRKHGILIDLIYATRDKIDVADRGVYIVELEEWEFPGEQVTSDEEKRRISDHNPVFAELRVK